MLSFANLDIFLDSVTHESIFIMSPPIIPYVCCSTFFSRFTVCIPPLFPFILSTPVHFSDFLSINTKPSQKHTYTLSLRFIFGLVNIDHANPNHSILSSAAVTATCGVSSPTTFISVPLALPFHLTVPLYVFLCPPLLPTFSPSSTYYSI